MKSTKIHVNLIMIAIVPSLKKKRAKTTSGMCTTNICYKLMYMYIQCTILFQVLNFLRNIGKKNVGNTET